MNISGKIVLKNSFFNIAGQGLPSVAAIIVFPFIIRYLGQDRFGLLMLIFAIQGYLEFLNLRLGFALTKFASEAIYKRDERRLSQLTWTTISYLIFLGAIGTIIIVILTAVNAFTIFKIPENLWFETRLSLIFTAISLPLIFASTGWRALLAAGQRFDLINIIHAPISCLRYIIVLSLAAKGFYLPVIMLAILLTHAFSFVIYFGVCLRLYPSIKDFSFDSQASRSLLWFGGWLSVSQIVGMALQYLDRFIIASLLPVGNLTYYAVPMEIVNKLGLIPQAISRSAFPILSALKKSFHSIQLYTRILKFMMVSAAPLIFIISIFSEDILALYVGKDFAINSTSVLKLLILGFFFMTVESVIINYALALGYADVFAKFRLIEFLLYGGISIYLTKKYGIQGMALAYLVLKISEASFGFIILQNNIPDHLDQLISNRVINGAILPIALFSFIFFISSYFNLSFFFKILIISIGIFIYTLCIWKYVLTPQEIRKFKKVS
ncbi:MAG: oligosaccharide flippase family protein [Candidatus Aenigmatarchaeota archaeon]